MKKVLIAVFGLNLMCAMQRQPAYRVVDCGCCVDDAVPIMCCLPKDRLVTCWAELCCCLFPLWCSAKNEKTPTADSDLH